MKDSTRVLLNKIKKREALLQRVLHATPTITQCPDVDMVKIFCLPYYDNVAFDLCESTFDNDYKIKDGYMYYPTVGNIQERRRLTKTPIPCPSCNRMFKPETYTRLNGMKYEQKYCDRCYEPSVRNGIKKYGSYEAYFEAKKNQMKKRKILSFRALKKLLQEKDDKHILQLQMNLYNDIYNSGYKNLDDFKEHILFPNKKIEELGQPKQSDEEIEVWGKDLSQSEVNDALNMDNDYEDVIDAYGEYVMQESTEVLELSTNKYIYSKEFEGTLSTLKEHKITFLTGKAGTGKTTFLKAVKEKYENVVVVAPTGIAALNAGGVTINSFFQMSFRPYMPNDEDLSQKNIASKFKYTKAKQEIIRNMNLLVIDEVSMVKSYTLDVIDKLLRYYRRNSTEAFGGVQVLLIGDLLQLPPVVTNKDGERSIVDRFYDSEFFFDAKVILEHGLTYRELTKVYRQKDVHFIDLLGRIRIGKQTKFDLDRLNRRLTNETQNGFITLTNTKRKAQAINDERLNVIKHPSVYFDAKILGEFSPSEYPTQKRLELKVGAQVMIIKNRNSYVNGMIGVIKSITSNVVQVKVDNALHNVVLDVWQKEKYVYEKGKINTEVIGVFEQFPLMLAWAINIHKSQGLTFDKVKVDCRGAFANGQTYVALSRCRSMDGLELGSKISWNDIKVSDKVIQFLSKYVDTKMNDVNDGTTDDIVDVEVDENISTEKFSNSEDIHTQWPYVSDDMPFNIYEDDEMLDKDNESTNENFEKEEKVDVGALDEDINDEIAIDISEELEILDKDIRSTHNNTKKVKSDIGIFDKIAKGIKWILGL